MAAKTSDWRPGPTVCRCCLTEGCYKDISTEYFWMGKREVYAEMLSETLDVSISYSKSGGPNSNSRLICEPCIARLRDASDFKRQVLECEKTFMQHLDSGSVSAEKEDVLTLKEVKVELVKQEGKLSDDDDDFEERVDFVVENDDTDDDLDNEPLMKLATKVPKKEVELLDLLDNSEITVKRKSTSTKTKEPPAKKVKKREIVIKPSASKASASSDPQVIKKKKDPGKRRLKVGEYHDARDNAAIILECSNVCPFKWRKNVFGCSYCGYTSPDFGIFKNHVHTVHPVKSERIEFLRNSRPADTVKVDIENLRCDLCQESIKDVATLMEHLIDKHDKPLVKKYGSGIVAYLLDKGFICAYCGESFDRFVTLNTHAIQHKQNFACSQCGQFISTPEGLRKHILRRHVKTPRNDFRPKLSDYNDARYNASIILECSNICPFKWHRNVFRCGYCEFKSADFGPVRAHIHSVHPKRLEALHYSRPTEIFKADITDLKCNVCDQNIQDMKALVDHLSSIHGKSLKKHYGLGIVPFLLSDGFMCADCGLKFDRFMKLNIHVNEHYPNCICSQCGQAFSSVNRLRAHSEQHKKKLVQFKCTPCGEVFASRSIKQNHMVSKHDILPHKCPYCKDAFKSYAHRLQHLNKFHGKKIEFPCGMCSTIFKTSSKRADHMRHFHLKDKQYPCSACDYVCTSGKQLKKHMMKHSSDRKYKC